MNDTIELLREKLPRMEDVINMSPGEPFRMNGDDSLPIIEKRLSDSDLKDTLRSFDQVLSGSPTEEMISESFLSFLKIRSLVSAGDLDFTGKSYRILFKELELREKKISNIIKLSEASLLASDEIRREEIEKTLSKNRLILKVVSKKKEAVKKKIDRLPKEDLLPEEESGEAQQKPRPKENMLLQTASDLLSKAKDFVEKIISLREEKQYLKEEEKQGSKTYLKEIPYYEKTILYQEEKGCRDIKGYCVLKKGKNYFFGLSGNCHKNIYDNSDNSLLELTAANEEVVQFLTEDLLSGEYKLSIFSESEKKAMRAYFNFMSYCFEAEIGKSLTLREYVNFKNYYNALSSLMFSLEKEDRDSYYRALRVAEKYVGMMTIYDLIPTVTKEEAAEKIKAGEVDDLISDIDLIAENHVIAPESGNEINGLIEEIRSFAAPAEEGPKESKEEKEKAEEVSCQAPEGQETGKLPAGDHYSILLTFFDEDGALIDTAEFSDMNLGKALKTYIYRAGYKKDLSIRTEDSALPLYTHSEPAGTVFGLSEEKMGRLSDKERKAVYEVKKALSDLFMKESTKEVF